MGIDAFCDRGSTSTHSSSMQVEVALEASGEDGALTSGAEAGVRAANIRRDDCDGSGSRVPDLSVILLCGEADEVGLCEGLWTDCELGVISLRRRGVWLGPEPVGS